MKKITNMRASYVFSFFWMIFLISHSLMGQNEVIRETRDVPSFDQIDIGGAFDVTLTIGEPQKVEVEARQKVMDQISTEVRNSKLVVSSKGVKSKTPLNIYLTAPALSRIELHGAADLRGVNPIKAEMLTLDVSGAASADLTLEVNTLRSEASGAADLELSGTAQQHSAIVSGAATLNARKLKTITTDADVSGAGTANVNADNITGKTSGAGSINSVEGDWESIDSGETTKRHKSPKFNGHWAGLDIGLNGYVNPDFNMNFPKEYEYMDLRMEKSIAVNLNFFEQNIPLAKNQKWGMLTGLGLGFNDYRFMRPTRLSMDSSVLVGYIDQDINIRKSKLSAMYLTLPVLLEFQTAPSYHKNGFHINVGMVVSARLSSHTKKYYDELNSEFNVTQYNPETGQYEVVYTSISPDDPKAHHYGDWFLQPFKFEATARIGWNFLNFWANYSLNTMFREGKGPELYPWSAGITLLCF